MEKKTRFQMSELTRRMVERLGRLRQGELVPWKELSNILGLNAQEEGRHYVDQARRVLLRPVKDQAGKVIKPGMVLEPIVGEGIKWLTDHEIATQIPTLAVRSIHNKARRGKRKIDCADYSKLNRDEQIAYNTGQAMLGFFEQSSSRNECRAVRERIANNAMPSVPRVE